jgi:carbon-monoxide dehydrogenase medium subunit
LLKDRYPLIPAVVPQIADPLVRNLGTIGGALAYADPSGDWGAVMLALGAHVVACSVNGERVIPITEFLRGAYSTTLEPHELVTEFGL